MIGEYIHIGEAARILGIHPHTLLRWEKAGLCKISRDSLGKRIYRKEDLPKLFSKCYGRKAPGRKEGGWTAS